MFEILDPGPQSTVQDIGRAGFNAIGFPSSGAFDNFSLRIGNLLVGNDVGGQPLLRESPGDAGLEILLGNFRMRVLKETVIAITGADTSPTLNNERLTMWKAVKVHEGDIISLGFARSGLRSYITVAGGVDVPLFLGSRSTFLRSSVGGFEGRALRKGDVIKTVKPKIPLRIIEGRKVKPNIIPEYKDKCEIRVILGPQDYLFTDESVKTFLNCEWKVSPKSDRMGVRLTGPKLEFKPRPEYLVRDAGADPSNIVSDPAQLGGIQVAGGVEPIILGVDGPCAGGYAKIATVISADIPKVGQLRPGGIALFKEVSFDEAIRALEEVEKKINEGNIYYEGGESYEENRYQ